MNALKNNIRTLSKNFEPELIYIRNYFHKNPELSFQEFNTAAFIVAKLKEFGIYHNKGFVKTGILGWIEGKNPGKRTIALRADMDGLEIQENPDHNICSQNKGVMHGCGHDMHATCLLGAAKILNKIKDKFEGTVLLIFQPGEEKLPGGAKLMMEEGVFADKKPDWIIGLHVDPELKTGQIGFLPGIYMASCDEIYMTIRGKGGHAAAPHKINDTVLAASNIIVSLQQIISRNCPPAVPSVLSFGKFIANGATNIIPNETRIEGTFRAMNKEWRKKGHYLIKKMAVGIAENFGVSCEMDLRVGYPCLVNNPKYTLAAQRWAMNFFEEDQIKKLDIRLGGEDFAYFSQAFPATFFRFGVCPPHLDKMAGGLHSPDFFPDERAIVTGVNALAWLAVSFLQNNS